VRESVKEKKVQKRYDEEFKRQAVELVIHSGRTQAQIARELGVSEYSLTLWKKDYLVHNCGNGISILGEEPHSGMR
jgi:transposase-like protein